MIGMRENTVSMPGTISRSHPELSLTPSLLSFPIPPLTPSPSVPPLLQLVGRRPTHLGVLPVDG